MLIPYWMFKGLLACTPPRLAFKLASEVQASSKPGALFCFAAAH